MRRSPPLDEDDLLDCWELEINYDQQHPRRQSLDQQSIVEQAEDVLETYDSVYGRSDDFARIQREVQQQQHQQQLQQHQQQQQRTNSLQNPTNNTPITRVGGVDGALPYRAICCSIM